MQIPRNNPSLAGHFPGHPIVPGVVLLDEVILAIERQIPEIAIVFASGGFEIPACKFLSPVLPGATLSLILSRDGSSPTLAFRLHQTDQLVAAGSFRLATSNENGAA